MANKEGDMHDHISEFDETVLDLIDESEQIDQEKVIQTSVDKKLENITEEDVQPKVKQIDGEQAASDVQELEMVIVQGQATSGIDSLIKKRAFR